MKLRNVSTLEQRVAPTPGPSFTCPPGAEVEVADVCGAELLEQFPSVWAKADVKPKKKSGGDK